MQYSGMVDVSLRYISFLETLIDHHKEEEMRIRNELKEAKTEIISLKVKNIRQEMEIQFITKDYKRVEKENIELKQQLDKELDCYVTEAVSPPKRSRMEQVVISNGAEGDGRRVYYAEATSDGEEEQNSKVKQYDRQ